MPHFYNQSINEILTHFKTAENEGLTSDEAKLRLSEYGYNQLDAKHKKTFFRMFIARFKSFMIIVLLIAAAISGVVGLMGSATVICSDKTGTLTQNKMAVLFCPLTKLK